MAYDGSIKIDTNIDTKNAETQLAKLHTLANKGAKLVGAAVTTTVAGIAAAGTAAAKVGSDFEAAMSKVAAVSGATGKDLADLTSKAKEMGAKTKFSATESAQAFNYMAMAGWDSKSMLDGIDGIMSLSAADGLDLATTSDIVTDALTAFGLQAKDSGHFADVLAKASSSANTNVSMLGESFKYVAPLAGTLGYSIEDMSVVLGLMANASVKGSMAGTSLKMALSNMAAPTKNMAGVMEQYGLSLTDANGKMLPLAEVTQQLRDKLGKLSEAEQSAAASTLFGKEAMSGMLAVINASDKDYAKLVKSINNADGAAKQMADTMQDNLQGQFTIFKSSLEGLGLEIYESLQVPLKAATEIGIEDVNKLTDAFKAGGLEGAVSAAGDMFGNLAVTVASHADGMVNASVQFIQSFARGIANNSGKLRDAAVNVTKVFVNGLVDLLPKEVAAPIRKTVDAIGKSFNSGNLKQTLKSVAQAVKSAASVAVTALNTIFPPLTKLTDKGVVMLGNALQKTAKIISNVAKAVLPPLGQAIDFVADNLDVLLPALAGMFTAFKAYAIVTTLTGAINGVSAATTIATAAQWAWNTALNANPIGLVIAAVAALAAGIGVLCLTMRDEQTDYAALTEAEQKFVDQVNEEYEAYQQLQTAKKEAMDAAGAEFDYYAQLKSELDGLVDKNGKIKQGYEERAAFISGELSKATGTEIQIVDGVIQKYSELSQTIEDLILIKRAEAMLSAGDDSYTSAIKNRTDGYKKYKAALDQVAKTERQLKTVTKLYEQLDMLRSQTFADPAATNAEQAEIDARFENAKAQMEGLKSKLSTFKDTLNTTEDEYIGYQATIQNYEGVSAAIISGDTDKISASLARMENDFITAEVGTKRTLTNQVKDMQDNYKQLKSAIDIGAPGVTQEMVDNAKQMVDQSKKELDKFEAKAKESTTKAGWAAVNGLKDRKEDAKAAAKDISDSADKSLRSADTKKSGETQGKNYVAGVRTMSVGSYNAGKKLSEEAADGADSVDAQPSGTNFVEGFISGLLGNIKGVFDAACSVGQQALNAIKEVLNIHSPSRAAMEIGGLFDDGLAVGVCKKTGDVILATASVARAMVRTADDIIGSHKLSGTMVDKAGFVAQGKQAAREFVAKTQAELDRASYVARMRATVQANQMRYHAEMEAASGYKAGDSPAGGGDDRKTIVTGTIETRIDIDGREVAIATAPYTAEELDFI